MLIGVSVKRTENEKKEILKEHDLFFPGIGFSQMCGGLWVSVLKSEQLKNLSGNLVRVQVLCIGVDYNELIG